VFWSSVKISRMLGRVSALETLGPILPPGDACQSTTSSKASNTLNSTSQVNRKGRAFIGTSLKAMEDLQAEVPGQCDFDRDRQTDERGCCSLPWISDELVVSAIGVQWAHHAPAEGVSRYPKWRILPGSNAHGATILGVILLVICYRRPA
jgi:hypothetical protein